MIIQLMTWGLYVAAALSLIVIATWLHIIFWGWYYRQREICGPLSWVYSPDGWRIALEQIPARRGVPYKGQAICCPGLACNGRIFHFREGLSFARDLSDEGWTVWVLHPRGTGPSERPLGGEDKVYGYQEYVKDGVAAMEFVRARNEGPLIWVGHSLGGLIGLEVARLTPHSLDGLITLGTPIALNEHNITPFYYTLFKWFCRGLKTAYLGKLSTFVAPWSGWVHALHPKPLYVNFDLINEADLRTVLAQGFEDTPRRILDEFVAAIERSEGPWDWFEEELRELNIPLLAFAGDRDALAPLSVTEPISCWGHPQSVEFHILEGFSHLELVLSEGVQREVMPRLHSWWTQQEIKRDLQPPQITNNDRKTAEDMTQRELNSKTQAG